MNVRAIDIIWRKRKEECEEELKEILGTEELDPTSPEYFQQRLAAAKVVLDRLSVSEREELNAEMARIKEQGHDKEVQQQYVPGQRLSMVTDIPGALFSLAGRRADQRISNFAKERWLEMGMLTLTVAAYTLPNGQLAVTV